MNYFQALTVGFAVLGAYSSLQAGQPTPPIKIGNSWYALTPVAAPNQPKA